MEEHFDLDDFEVEDFQTPNNDVEVFESPSSEMSFATIDEARRRSVNITSHEEKHQF
ncbi:hypothetical protein RHMOL_Rhmol04G0153900 [Rhododendron molle]|uniref:Uncharacterized protein n=1 Tax=Rhododendron molle TaxID=49168 RepID=A0ACC0P0P3_RHOML|nr:hypothetical protein RHMOL_Rhmol04G0153900 [Rhododendron molle]